MVRLAASDSNYRSIDGRARQGAVFQDLFRVCGHLYSSFREDPFPLILMCTDVDHANPICNEKTRVGTRSNWFSPRQGVAESDREQVIESTLHHTPIPKLRKAKSKVDSKTLKLLSCLHGCSIHLRSRKKMAARVRASSLLDDKGNGGGDGEIWHRDAGRTPPQPDTKASGRMDPSRISPRRNARELVSGVKHGVEPVVAASWTDGTDRVPGHLRIRTTPRTPSGNCPHPGHKTSSTVPGHVALGPWIYQVNTAWPIRPMSPPPGGGYAKGGERDGRDKINLGSGGPDEPLKALNEEIARLQRSPQGGNTLPTFKEFLPKLAAPGSCG